MDNELYGGSFASAWRRIIDRKKNPSKKERAIRDLIAAMHHLRKKSDQLQAENENLRTLAGFALTDACGCKNCTFERMVSKVAKLQAEMTELRARLHRLDDDRLEESIKHIETRCENEKLKEQARQLKAENKELKYESTLLARLASDKSEFFNPILVAQAMEIRDRVLKGGE